MSFITLFGEEGPFHKCEWCGEDITGEYGTFILGELDGNGELGASEVFRFLEDGTDGCCFNLFMAELANAHLKWRLRMLFPPKRTGD
mgnify:CR=1 FL=1